MEVIIVGQDVDSFSGGEKETSVLRQNFTLSLWLGKAGLPFATSAQGQSWSQNVGSPEPAFGASQNTCLEWECGGREAIS